LYEVRFGIRAVYVYKAFVSTARGDWIYNFPLLEAVEIAVLRTVLMVIMLIGLVGG
jgi:hypothetical protein